MNAVVLTAVLSCLNSGLYTASRMLFVLAGRREAPMALITVNGRGVPVWAILASTVVGFLCVIAAYVSPDTVFLFLLNSSGAVILFVYLLIAISQYVLRRQTPRTSCTVKMWFFPYLTIVAALGIVGVLAADVLHRRDRSQLVLSLLSWGVVLALYAVTRWRGGSMSAEEVEAKKAGPSGRAAERILVLANQTLVGEQLHDTLLGIDGSDRAEYLVVVPANPVDTDRRTARARRSCGRRPPGRPGAARADALDLAGAWPHRTRRARRLPSPARARQGRARVQTRPRRDLHAPRGALDLAASRGRRRGPQALRRHRHRARGRRARAGVLTRPRPPASPARRARPHDPETGSAEPVSPLRHWLYASRGPTPTVHPPSRFGVGSCLPTDAWESERGGRFRRCEARPEGGA